MAEGVLLSFAKGILSGLGSLIANKIGLPCCLPTDLQRLENTVTTIKNVLQDAEKQQTGSEAVRGWLERLDDLLYEADDLLDAISTEAHRQEMMTGDKIMKEVCIFFSESNQLVYGLIMGCKIKKIREKFDGIVADMNNLNFLVKPVEEKVIHRKRVVDRETHSYLDEETVIGREDDKKTIIDYLMESNLQENVSVISIVGLGGLGKTTLAKDIFHDKDIEKNFEVKVWVCVSDEFGSKVIIKKILESITKETPKSDLMDRLVGDLRKVIDGKKYLLVLDDMWNENNEEWFNLKNQLRIGGKGSKILVTTRKKNVATRIMQSKEIHNLEGLEEGASWELFEKVAFENGVAMKSLEEMGKKILQKCKGVPLAIKTVGRLLYSESLERWRQFVDEELPNIDEEGTNILPTLKLSYDDLPSHLKQCFSFCSLFPKDYIFDPSTLINLWIANGYVESKEHQCWEEIGHKYFMNLLWRSFFQEAKMNEFGKVITCKMHDLMHDLAILVARKQITTFPFKDNINYKKIRHIAIANNASSDYATMGSLYDASMIRTFLCSIAYESDYQVQINYEAIVKSFKFLRVLDLSERKLKYVPNSISRLKHLRYLNLSDNPEIKELPRSITVMINLQYLCLSNCLLLVGFPKGFKRLVNLRHLDLNGCESLRCMLDEMGQLTNLHMLDVCGCKLLKELPGDIIKLVKLRFLYMDSDTGLEYLPHGFGKLTNLQELPYFVANFGSTSGDSGGLDELNSLNNLRGSLEIKVLSCGKDVGKNYELDKLKDKQNFDSLMVNYWNAAENDFVDNILLESLQLHLKLEHLNLWGDRCSRHPTWMSSVTKLVSLRLIRCTKWQYLPPLGHLPFLENLYLEHMDGIEYISNCDEWSASSSSSSAPLPLFPSLKEISVGSCKNLKGWWKNSPAEVESLLVSFPLLSSVYISHCPMLTSMPIFWHLKESLMWRGTNWKTLQQTLLMNTSATTTCSVPPCALLSKLNELQLSVIEDLENLPEEGLQNLTSLKILKFFYCRKLKSLSPGVQHLTKVQRLEIWSCEMFGDNEDRMQWEGLKSLSSLLFKALPNLSSLPLGLQHVSTLKSLSIVRCESLTSVPYWIHNCQSLEELCIDHCFNLASLPVGMCERWSLQRLVICGSLCLLQKCEKEKGEYWPKIAHIPHLNIS